MLGYVLKCLGVFLAWCVFFEEGIDVFFLVLGIEEIDEEFVFGLQEGVQWIVMCFLDQLFVGCNG